MKKALVFVLALLLTLSAPAMAQVCEIDEKYQIDLPDELEPLEISAEDAAEGLLLDMYSPGLNLVVTMEPNDGSTLDEWLGFYQDQDDEFISEATLGEGAQRYIIYRIDLATFGAMALDEEDVIYDFRFLYEDATEMSEAQAVMDTLRLA